jgi:hypothetical protein
MLYADTYTWTDEKGTVFYTDDPGSLPKEIRKKARKVDAAAIDDQAKPDTAEPNGEGDETAKPAPPPSGSPSREINGNGVYGGKTYGQWQRENDERLAAMTEVRRKIDELAEKIKSLSERKEQTPLITAYDSLAAELKELRSQYYQFVESARKAGLQITIKE